MLFWLQTTFLRWAVESLAQQLLIQVVAFAMSKTAPAPQFTPERTTTPGRCGECGRPFRSTLRSVNKRRSRPAKRASELPVATRQASAF